MRQEFIIEVRSNDGAEFSHKFQSKEDARRNAKAFRTPSNHIVKILDDSTVISKWQRDIAIGSNRWRPDRFPYKTEHIGKIPIVVEMFSVIDKRAKFHVQHLDNNGAPHDYYVENMLAAIEVSSRHRNPGNLLVSIIHKGHVVKRWRRSPPESVGWTEELSCKPLKGPMVIASALEGSPLYPRVGELWNYQGKISFVAGNCLEDKDGKIGARILLFDWDSGNTVKAPLSRMTIREDRHAVINNRTLIADKFTQWAKGENAAAMWFLGWWYELSNHKKSVWFYIAALRGRTDVYKWSYTQILSGANNPPQKPPSIHDAYGRPVDVDEKVDLQFLKEIPEMHKPIVYRPKVMEALNEALNA